MSGSHDYDVIVVGTGYGGAVQPSRWLALDSRSVYWSGEPGGEVSEGHRTLPETIPQILAALARLNFSGFGRSLSIPLFRRGLIECSLHQGTVVVNSSAVGGNSVVSGAYCRAW